jgi:CheY-like chemotaxis protein
VLREEAELLERTIPSRIKLILELAPGLPPLLGDANALAHVFMNLCVNALDAMPEAGELTLRTLLGEDGRLEIQVQDTGLGMTPEVQARVLEPFFTTKPQGEGTGLGLSMAYATVKAHHGELDLQSEVGRGTRVRLRFPTTEAAAEPPAPEAEPVRDDRPLKVLVVDDDDMIRDSVEDVLIHLGHAATCAASGEEALERLEAGYRPDLIILDMNMPGLGGEKTLPRVRSLCPRVPVLLATGRVDQAAHALRDADPHVSMLSKPFGLNELRRCLGNVGRA